MQHVKCALGCFATHMLTKKTKDKVHMQPKFVEVLGGNVFTICKGRGFAPPLHLSFFQKQYKIKLIDLKKWTTVKRISNKTIWLLIICVSMPIVSVDLNLV